MTVRLAHGAPQIWSDTIGAALVDRVAGRTFAKNLFARSDISSLQQRFDRGAGIRSAVRGFDALDDIAHHFGAFMFAGVEIFAADNGKTQSRDAASQYPTCNGVIVAHKLSQTPE